MRRRTAVFAHHRRLTTAYCKEQKTMANAEFTTTPHNVCHKCTSSADLPHASEHAIPDAQPDDTEEECLIDPLEKALEDERMRLMLANSVLGCLQIALDPEAVTITPAIYFPEVLELARQFINKSVTQLEYEEIRRLMHRSVSGGK
jgi:hypothetical protein